MVQARVLRFVAVVVVASASVCACGGSSSETPPPLSPDPLHDPYRAESARQTPAGSVRAAASAEPGALDPKDAPPTSDAPPPEIEPK